MKIVPMIAAGCVSIAPLFAACAPTDIKWTEEVKLHDGKTIQVKRRTELSATGFPTQARGQPRYHELCYAPMSIRWKSKAAYQPEAFDIFGGVAYVRVPLRGCSSCMLHGYPHSNSIFFAWRRGHWEQIDEKQAPDDLRLNLLRKVYVDDDGAKDARGLVTVLDKEERDANLYSVLRRTGGRGVNDFPKLRDYCEKCKTGAGTTSASAEVLLPADKESCSW